MALPCRAGARAAVGECERRQRVSLRFSTSVLVRPPDKRIGRRGQALAVLSTSMGDDTAKPHRSRHDLRVVSH